LSGIPAQAAVDFNDSEAALGYLKPGYSEELLWMV